MPKRIAIVGGGPAGLSAAFHLTNEPGWETRYEITVYQLGWRLGGKGATGRDEDRGYRIEEHGIHGFTRFYFNTWAMMQRVYEDLDAADRARCPLKQLDEAFLPSSMTLSVESRKGCWDSKPSFLPINGVDENPWDTLPPNLSWRSIVLGMLDAMIGRDRRDQDSSSDLLSPSSFLQDLYYRWIAACVQRTLRSVRNLVENAWPVGVDVPDAVLTTVLNGASGRLVNIHGFVHELIDRLEQDYSVNAADALATLDMYLALFRGIISMQLWLDDRDVDDIDGWDYRDWLQAYGASEHTLNSSAVLATAHMLFAYPEGDSTKRPWLSAASWVSWLVRSLLGRGHYFYLMAAGTGDTVVLPLYLLLRRRGVQFEFFHKLTRIDTDVVGGEPSVARLVFQVQDTVPGGADYVPEMELPDGHSAWPNHPNWNQLEHGNGNLGVDYEDWNEEPAWSDERPLERGAADGFDHVVLAVPPSVVAAIDGDLSNAWGGMIDRVTTTATMAAQLWLDRSTADLGWEIPPHEVDTSRYASGSLPNPLNGMAVFDDLIEYEFWPDPPPEGLIYFCSQLHPKYADKGSEGMRVISTTAASLRRLGLFLKGSAPEGLDRVDPGAIDFDRLFDQLGRRGVRRLLDQFYRVNTDPHDAYVQANPNSAGARLFPWRSGFQNLTPAGDWVYTGINVGSFEGAVTGGKLAAHAVAGDPDRDNLFGFHLLHPNARDDLDAAHAEGLIPRVP